MTRDRRRAGIGAITFPVALVVGFTLFGPKGGAYSAAEIASFVGQSSISFVISIGLFAASIIGLIGLMTYLTESSFGAGRRSHVSWAMSYLAAASLLIGWGLYLAPAMSISTGGPPLDPGVTYAFLSAGMFVLFGVGGVTLGFALVVLAMGGQALPAWVRATTGVAGLSALLTWAFLVALRWSPNQWLPGPFYVVILWGLVIGVWLLVATRPERLDGTIER